MGSEIFQCWQCKSILHTSDLLDGEDCPFCIGEDKFMGEKICPALTINKRHIPLELAKKWQIYGLNSKSDNYHIFTYSCKNSDYERFANEYKR